MNNSLKMANQLHLVGIEHVFINGHHIVKDGNVQHKEFSGKVLKA